MIDGGIDELERILAIEALGGNRFLAAAAAGGGRTYGGTLLAQAYVAARSLAAAPIRSLHALFLRPGEAQADIVYQGRDLTGDGAVIAVDAIQHGRTLFVLQAAFGSADIDAAPHASRPATPPPARCLPAGEVRRGAPATPFEVRYATDVNRDPPMPPRHDVWVRLRAPLADAADATGALIYFSDDTIMDNALLPHTNPFVREGLVTASLDHVMWFHAPADMQDWLLFQQDSPVAAAGRGFTRGRFYDRDGALVASVAQEILMRASDHA